MAIGVAMCVVYGPYSTKTHEWSVAENVAYGSVFRCLWACSLGWLVFVSHNGQGGMLTSIYYYLFIITM